MSHNCLTHQQWITKLNECLLQNCTKDTYFNLPLGKHHNEWQYNLKAVKQSAVYLHHSGRQCINYIHFFFNSMIRLCCWKNISLGLVGSCVGIFKNYFNLSNIILLWWQIRSKVVQHLHLFPINGKSQSKNNKVKFANKFLGTLEILQIFWIYLNFPHWCRQ